MEFGLENNSVRQDGGKSVSRSGFRKLGRTIICSQLEVQLSLCGNFQIRALYKSKIHFLSRVSA